MKNLVLSFLFFITISSTIFAQDGKFSFTINSPASISAGVFENDSFLVKTLWSNTPFAAGTHIRYWDGTDDYGKKISNPKSNYKIKVLSNNVKYKWDGVVGNTSDALTGDTKHHTGYRAMKGLAFAGNFGYYCTGYSEGVASWAKFHVNSPNKRINLVPFKSGSTDINYVATDGKKVYWGAFDANSINNSFVFAINNSDDKIVKFSNGSSYTPVYRDPIHVISYRNTSNGLISGLAVQKSGDFLFVARAAKNQLEVLNKNTGELIKTHSYDNVRGLSVDKDDNLWMLTGTKTAAQYTVHSNGNLSSPTLSLQGLVAPLSTQISPDGNTVAVADGGSSQQVKFFSHAYGNIINTLGTPGGYLDNAAVNNNKFFFSNAGGDEVAFVAYQPDGSYWVNDPFNQRVQKYNSNNNFMDRIMYLGPSYSVYPDKNDIKRVFAGFLEFEIDYSVQNLTGTNGWTLINNWGGKISKKYDVFGQVQYPTTFSNGRTYGVVRVDKGDWEVVEFIPGGTLRLSGKYIPVGTVICGDGSMQQFTSKNNTATFTRYPVTGFDAANNPIWSKTGELLMSAPYDKNSPLHPGNSQVFSNTGKVVLFNPGIYEDYTGTDVMTGYHLGMVQRGAGGKYQFQTEKSTERNYNGVYPAAGWFDVGNGVNDYAGGNVNIVDRNIITTYHGEFWKNSQTNKFNHYYDNGLPIGQFGISGDELTDVANEMMAGNALTSTLVKDGNGDLYLWHGDESHHAGIHRWKITGLNTIKEEVVNINFPSAYTPPTVNYTDLMQGLPFNEILQNNTAGWTRYPNNNDERDPWSNLWSVNTTKNSYEKTSNDITVRYYSPNKGTNYVNRELGNNNVTNSWKISGEFCYPAGSNANGDVIQQYLDVLDANDKILTRIYMSHFRDVTTFYGNTAAITSEQGYRIKGVEKLQPIEFSIENGVAKFTYGNYPPVTSAIYDKNADWKRPKNLRISGINTGAAGSGYGMEMIVKDLKFSKDLSAAPAVNVAPVANAGSNQVITLPTNVVTLSGSGADSDGAIVKYQWVKTSGPASGTIVTANAATTLVENLSQGNYQFELTVTDNNGATAKDVLQVTVNQGAVIPPAVTLLPAVNPANTVNGLDYNYYLGRWDMLPAFATLSPNKSGFANKFDLSPAGQANDYGFNFSGFINVPVDGIYNFYTSSDDGSSLYIDNVLTVSNDGTHAAQERTGSIGLKAGKHAITALYFQQGGGAVFSVSYEGNGVSKQEIPTASLYRVSVNAPPVANAGTDQVITLPINTLTLNGTGTDADGTISGYAWSKISGPATGTIVTANAGTTVLSNLVEGVYEFELTVTDNKGAVAKDIVQVRVNAAAAANLLPAINPANTVNGLDYKYYHGSWNLLPDFASLNPVKSGTVNNFDLTPATRDDQFGFSFTGYITVPADGQYKFYTTSDDGSSLYIDNVLIVNNDGLHAPEVKSGTIGLKAGKHAITGLFFQQGGESVFSVSYEAAGIPKQLVPASSLYRVDFNSLPANNDNLLPAVNPANTVNGLDYSYYQGSWNVLPNFNNLDPVKVGTVDNFSLTPAGRTTQFGFRFTGYITVPADGQYTFYTTSDDGSNLYIDNVLTVSNDGLHAAEERFGTIGLKAGKHAITGLFFQQGGEKVFMVRYSSTGISKRLIPATALFRELPKGSGINTSENDTTLVSVSAPTNDDAVVSIGGQVNTSQKVSIANSLKVYPNPVKDFANLEIHVGGTNSKMSVSVYDNVGKLVLFNELKGIQFTTIYRLDMTRLGDGFYTVVVRLEDGSVLNHKILKSK